jgi:hypothetical protein
MNADSIHGDRAPPPAPQHPIKYYFLAPNHPVVFINTSNHAMAQHDANDRIWKWEYVPRSTDAPIKLGSMTRKEIEQAQTLPVGYTDILSYNQMQDVCGDGWTIDVIAHIFSFIK